VESRTDNVRVIVTRRTKGDRSKWNYKQAFKPLAVELVSAGLGLVYFNTACNTYVCIWHLMTCHCHINISRFRHVISVLLKRNHNKCSRLFKDSSPHKYAKMSIGSPERKKPLGKRRSRWENNIKLIFGWKDVKAATGLNWLKTGSNKGFLWTRWWIYSFHKTVWLLDQVPNKKIYLLFCTEWNVVSHVKGRT
jgi:hypothetical protein